MRIRNSRRNALGQAGRSNELAHLGTAVLSDAKQAFEVLVERELDGHMYEAEVRRQETPVEHRDALLLVHCGEGIEGPGIPLTSWSLDGTSLSAVVKAVVNGLPAVHLQHETSLDDPDRISQGSRNRPGRNRAGEVRQIVVMGDVPVEAFEVLVAAEVDHPGGEVAQRDGHHTSVKPPKALFRPDAVHRVNHPMVLGLGKVLCRLMSHKRALGLQPRLGNV